MKNELIKRFSTIVLFLAILALSAGNAFAITNNQAVVSPYWQSDSDSYTFVAVSHPSLTGMNSQIGVVLTAMTEDRTTTFGSSVFTVTRNKTTRVFIVATNHSTINSTNITGTDAVFITGTTNSTAGSLTFASRAQTPLSDRTGAGTAGTQMVDATMLSYWGAIVVSSTNSGFAMEFIGDTHDSVFNLLTTVDDNTTLVHTATPVGLQ
jgi:hypothetical protein